MRPAERQRRYFANWYAANREHQLAKRKAKRDAWREQYPWARRSDT